MIFSGFTPCADSNERNILQKRKATLKTNFNRVASIIIYVKVLDKNGEVNLF